MKNAVAIIAAFVRNAHMKRVLHKADADPHLNFWRLIHGNCLDMAVIEWLKLFDRIIRRTSRRMRNTLSSGLGCTLRSACLFESGRRIGSR